MKRIGTHNSATGERCKNLLSFFLIPFARCQSKTIAEQFNHGCRYFDFHVRYGRNGYYMCNGIFKTNRSLYGVLGQLNSYKESTYVSITLDNYCAFKEELARSLKEIVNLYPNIILTEVYVKKEKVFENSNAPRCVNMYIPNKWFFPWLVDRLCTRPHYFEEDYFTMVDFL